MRMTNDAAMDNAQAMIQLISDAPSEAQSGSNALQAHAYIASLWECRLIDRTQFDTLNVNARTARSAWTPGKGKRRPR